MTTTTFLLAFLLSLCICSSKYCIVYGQTHDYVGEVRLVSGATHALGPKLNKENAMKNEYRQPVVAVDDYDNIIVADFSIIRNISSGGSHSNVTVLAGNAKVTGYKDGPAAESLIIGVVSGMTITMKDGHPVVYFTDSAYIRKIEQGVVSTFVSTGLGNPHGIGVDKTGNIYVADRANSQVFKYSPNAVRLASFTITSPTDIVMSPEGNKLYVTWNVNNVMELETDFQLEDLYLTASSPVTGIAFGENGQFFYSTENGFFLYINRQSTELVAGTGTSSGYRDGDYPAPDGIAPVFSGIHSVASKSEYEFVFAESSTYYDVRIISVYPRNKPISWVVDVKVADIPYTNATVFEKIQADALEDMRNTLGVEITQPVKGVAGTPSNESVPMAFTLPAYARNYSSRVTVANSDWPLVTETTQHHNRAIDVALHIPIKDLPLNNATMMKRVAETVAADLRALTGAAEGDITLNTPPYRTVEGAVIFNLSAPNPLMNESTQQRLERPYPASYPQTNKLVEDYHKYRPLGLFFPAELVPKGNATVMKEVTELIREALANSTVTPASNFPFTATGDDLVKIVTKYDDKGVGTRYAVINGMIRGPIENATTTEILQNNKTFAKVFDYLAKFNAPRRMGITFTSVFGLPVCCKGPMVESTEAFKKDLETLFNSSDFTMRNPPFVIDEATNTTIYSADIPGGFENQSTSERLEKFKWPALTAFVSQPTITKTVTMKGPLSRWPLSDEEKMKRVRELLVEDAQDYYGYHGPHIILTPTPTIHNDTEEVSWTFHLPKNGVSTEGKDLSNSTFPKTNAYLASLQPNERALDTSRSAPEFFSGSCGKGCVIGIAVACAIVLAVIVVIIVLVVSKRKRRSNVVAPSFDPTMNSKAELE